MPKKETIYKESPIHIWFELSYASYLVIQRSLLEGMPIEWQEKLSKLLDELEEVYDSNKIPSEYWVRAQKDGKFITDPYREYRRPGELPYKKIDDTTNRHS